MVRLPCSISESLYLNILISGFLFLLWTRYYYYSKLNLLADLDWIMQPPVSDAVIQEAYYMQISYFTRLGRNKKIAEGLAGCFCVAPGDDW